MRIEVLTGIGDLLLCMQSELFQSSGKLPYPMGIQEMILRHNSYSGYFGIISGACISWCPILSLNADKRYRTRIVV